MITRRYVLSFKKPTNRGQQGKRIPCWMSKHPVFCSILKRLHDDHRYSEDPFCALAEFKVICEKAKKQAFLELARRTAYSLGAAPERLKPPFPHEDDVTSDNDFFTSWAKIKPEALLALHMADAHRAAAKYHEASERKTDASSLVHHADRRAVSRSARQRRLSIDNWNPGLRRGDEDAFVKQIAGNWHIIHAAGGI